LKKKAWGVSGEKNQKPPPEGFYFVVSNESCENGKKSLREMFLARCRNPARGGGENRPSEENVFPTRSKGQGTGKNQRARKTPRIRGGGENGLGGGRRKNVPDHKPGFFFKSLGGGGRSKGEEKSCQSKSSQGKNKTWLEGEEKIAP